jgi:hypothetical protein
MSLLFAGGESSLLQAGYAMWESSLADSRSLINVNGVFIRFFKSITQAGIYPSLSTYRLCAIAMRSD